MIQKISRQSTSTSRPPTSGPIASASAEIAAQIPSARACFSPGKASLTIASESGSIAAAPMPWTTLPAISVPSLDAAPESTEPPAKIARPIVNTARRP